MVQKTIYILFILLYLGYNPTLAQDQDSSYKKKALTTLDVSAFFSFYNQDGQHSAVTGGTGDERLMVAHVGLEIHGGINASMIIFGASVDMITSPSTDKIDFIRSSASLYDNHVQAKAGYQYQVKNPNMTFGAMYLFSMESDYFSNGVSAWCNFVNNNKTRAYGISTDVFFDDLRWGRLSARTGGTPTTMIYPSELRRTKWSDIYHRNSYNLNFNFRQDLNKKLTINLSFGTSFQEGFLSTPFHRIYFSDTSQVRIEKLPQYRIRLPLSIAANWFVHQHVVLQSDYRIYWDNFGIFAHTLHFQTAIKPHNKISLYPFVRAYYQTASPYFAPFQQHLSDASFYTSDYDFSSFWTFKFGLGLGWNPDARLGGKKSKVYFNSFVLRYSFMYRTDGLSAHVVSLQMRIKK